MHRERIRGFSKHLAENPTPGLQFAHLYFGTDSRSTRAALVRHAPNTWPGLARFYYAGGGNSGVLEMLSGAAYMVFLVGQELNEAAALGDGAADVTFDQLPKTQARRPTTSCSR